MRSKNGLPCVLSTSAEEAVDLIKNELLAKNWPKCFHDKVFVVAQTHRLGRKILWFLTIDKPYITLLGSAQKEQLSYCDDNDNLSDVLWKLLCQD